MSRKPRYPQAGGREQLPHHAPPQDISPSRLWVFLPDLCVCQLPLMGQRTPSVEGGGKQGSGEQPSGRAGALPHTLEGSVGVPASMLMIVSASLFVSSLAAPNFWAFHLLLWRDRILR